MSQNRGVAAYPLQWPAGRPRTKSRQASNFKVAGIGQARDELLREIHLLRGRHVVISSNLQVRNDGLPYANQRQPEDPGVAVYYVDGKGRQRCFACDRWRKVEDNLRAIQKTIEALRGVERWGSGDDVEAAFSGFAALPPAYADRPWWEVLGVDPFAPTDYVQDRYRRLALEHHPDRNGGDGTRMGDINSAYDRFKRERGLAAAG
jgi:hypothetical protein